MMGIAEHPAQTAKRKTIKCRIAAIMTLPRVGWTDARGVAEEALRLWSIPILTRTGAFWAEGLQNAMQLAILDGFDWLLTIDYDTMFTAEHVARLMQQLASDDQIDSITGLQPKRRTHTPIGFAVDSENVKAGAPIRVSSAHFGLTLFRVESLKRTPLPWCMGLPNAAGEWVEERGEPGDDPVLKALHALREAAGLGDFQIDADVWFWRQWARAGNQAYIDPEVLLGHLEVNCVHYEWVERNGVKVPEPRITAPDDWRRAQIERLQQCVQA